MIWSIQCRRSNCRFLDGGECAYSATVSISLDGKCETFKPHDHQKTQHNQVKKQALIAALIMLLIVAGRTAVQRDISNMADYYESVIEQNAVISQRRIAQLEKENAFLALQTETLRAELEEARSSGWVPVVLEVTGYAPLDPQAVPGMCYSGDPTITASGEPSTPGVSIAAGPGVPFGTEVYVPGYGVGVVHDRGGMISDDHIDLMFATRGQAMAWGRQTVTVWVKE